MPKIILLINMYLTTLDQLINLVLYRPVCIQLAPYGVLLDKEEVHVLKVLNTPHIMLGS